jgi:type I restriction enzyme S subunit
MSWKMVNLGSVCKIVNGGTPKSEVADYWDGELNWITPKDMGKLKTKEVNDTERKITEKGLKNSSAKMLPVNSIILSSRAPIGHLAINKVLMATNQGCKGLIPNKELNFNYLYYYLFCSKQLLNDLGSGATFKELSGSKLAEVEIPLPLLSIQLRIVESLDAIFTEIERATAATENKLNEFKNIKQSILQQAFNGVLVKE